MRTVYLVRHAQSQPSHELPDAEWPLSPHGRTQAQRLAEVLGALGIEEVHTSPYQRCRDTIAPFVAASAAPLHQHHDLRERKIAGGLIDDFPSVWRRSWADFSFALPDCETSHATQERIHAAVLAICARSAARRIAISSHGNALSLLVNRVDARFDVVRASAMRNPDVLRMTYREGALVWDDVWEAPELGAFASHHDETPFPPRKV
jgi:broad specificity phosphatase PhoE